MRMLKYIGIQYPPEKPMAVLCFISLVPWLEFSFVVSTARILKAC